MGNKYTVLTNIVGSINIRSQIVYIFLKTKSGSRQVVLLFEVQQYPSDAINVKNYLKASMSNVSPGI